VDSRSTEHAATRNPLFFVVLEVNCYLGHVKNVM